jgi:hypothetical protein
VGLCQHVNRNGAGSVPVSGSEQSVMSFADPDIVLGF